MGKLGRLGLESPLCLGIGAAVATTLARIRTP